MTTQEILDAFPRRTALVVGDICLDRWCTYDPAFTEPSRETGIDRLAVTGTEITAGGGGTVANNLSALGIGSVSVLGAIGEDGFSYELLAALNRRGIAGELLIRSADLPTFTYTKIINSETGIEDRPRVDFIHTREIPESVESRILGHLKTYAGAFDVIYVADQAETLRGGVVTPAMRETLAKIALAKPEKIVWVDSRLRSELFRHVVLKPNQQEAEAACHRLYGRIDYPRLRQSADAKLLYVTHGARGVLVVGEDGETFVPARLVEHPVDICGAGDSFSAGAGIALSITGSPIEAARFGNLIASITITKKGTGTASPEEVLAAL